jgi:DNA polymerase-3 subunit delta
MANIHLTTGESYNLVNNTIEELIEGYEDIQKYDLDELDINSIITSASYYGLFNTKAVIINNVKYFGGKFLYEDEVEVLYNYLSNLDDNTIVILNCIDITNSKDITKKVVSLGATIHNTNNYKEDEINNFIHKYTDKNNIKIDDDTIKLLLNKVGDNIDLFINELNKLSIVNNKIDKNLIDEYSSYNEENVTYDFINAIVSKDFDKGFDLLDNILSKGMEVPAIVGMLASKYKEIFFIKDCLNNNLSDEAICDLLSQGGKKWTTGRLFYGKKNTRIYTYDELKDIIINLSIVDKKIKTGSNPVYTLKEFLLNI